VKRYADEVGSGRYILAVLLWAAMAPALSVIVCAAVERTGGANDTAERGRQAVAQKLALAREAEKEAKAVADSDELAAKAECATGRGQKAPSALTADMAFTRCR